MKEAILYDKLPDKKVRCHVCRMRCTIADGKYGYCCTRYNEGGILYTIIYNKVSSMNADPIEKKPLYHFYPGSICFSLGSIGCNFKCPGCQNWEISQSKAYEKASLLENVTPEESVALAKKYKARGISWTYNEPAIWLEYTIDGAKIAKREGLYTVYVTNGYITPEALAEIGPYLDAFRVDIKGSSKESYQKITGVRSEAEPPRRGCKEYEGVMESAELAKRKWNMHVECVTNVTPTINDSETELRAIASFIKNKLGPETPWHVTRFYPYLELSNLPPTPIATLEKARQIGFEEGLFYVYIGNIPTPEGENTYCPKCKELLIKREGYIVTNKNLRGGSCGKCNATIYGRF